MTTVRPDDAQRTDQMRRPARGTSPAWNRGLRIIRSSGTLIGLIAIIAIFGIAAPQTFLTAANATNILEQIATLTVVATVQTIVMVVGDFDLSVGATASLAAVTAASMMVAGVPVPVAIVIALLVGAAIGALNGILVAYIGLSAFVATLASMTSIVGVAYIVSGGTTIFALPEAFVAIGSDRVLGLPVTVVIAIVIVVIGYILLKRTTLGRRLYAVGGNPKAALLSGVKVDRIRFTAFVIVGVGAAIGGLFLAARLNSAQATIGEPVLLPSIAAVFLGMTMYRDGSPRVVGTLVGVAILGVLSNGLNITGVNSYVQQAVTGLIIILAVAIPSFSARRKAR